MNPTKPNNRSKVSRLGNMNYLGNTLAELFYKFSKLVGGCLQPALFANEDFF